MCGIAGIFNKSSAQDVEEPRLWSMLTTLRYRGPDADGTWLDARGLGLGHVRPAVIDLSTASNQPFVAEDGVVSGNGSMRRRWNQPCARHGSGEVDLSSQIFRWISLELWCQRALDRA